MMDDRRKPVPFDAPDPRRRESPTPGATGRRNWPSVTVHFVWATAVVVALCAPIFLLKSFRAENRRDVSQVVDGLGRVFHQDVTHHFSSSLSEVGEGRLLELARLRTNESLSQTLTRGWLGLDAVSSVRLDAPVIYRYGVRWDTGWRVSLSAAPDSSAWVCLVDAPALEPFQPPTVDTSGFRVATQEPWLAPSTRASREELIRSFTPHVAEIANTREYRSVVRELARRTLVDYVEQWLLRARLVDPAMPITVYARFADDAPDSLHGGTMEYEAIRFR